ncbi:AI-2E family transporter [Salisediminibacterium selenitireducens]|uniref:AI-2E family transporter n=1 Tax=Bacillus selenitireducens (strain ATCC 700615 / DSM 15326 / MLS10) TaxID=439292 RepID=D6XSL6_BACIE|nr:AI-2E family transporter [Salisediminibacterium selenitireducens]ADH98802.1 protein of unknown function UPF0118 [[Bacillus] selenitireducens MLS10]
MYLKLLKVGSLLIMLFLLIYLGSLIDWVFTPISVFISTAFFPLLFAGVLYYLFRPIVNLLSRKFPRGFSIALLYIGFLGLGAGAISLIGPELQKQFYNLMDSVPGIMNDLQYVFMQLQETDLIEGSGLEEWLDVEDRLEEIGAMISTIAGGLVSNTMAFLGTLFNTLLLFFIVPFILFFLLKDGDRLAPYALKFFSEEKQEEIRPVLQNMDFTISRYIQGILIVCTFIGVLYYTGFTIIGVEYSLILAIIGMFTNVIPYVGPWLGAVPAVIVALIHSPLQAFLVIVLVVIIQQVESILIQPNVIGRVMRIHPVTVLLLVLVAGQFAGILGMILVIPVYAVTKVVVTHLYEIWRGRDPKKVSI